MGFARKCKRRLDRKNRQCRTTCPKCHAKLIEKARYGQVCQECGWMKFEAKDSSDVVENEMIEVDCFGEPIDKKGEKL